MSKVLCGDAAEVLQSLPQGSASMCVTSPPYYGLRDYGEEGQIGIEPTPREYVGRLVEVFDEVYRVLADDGTLWLNIGDSYAGSGKGPMSIQVAGNGKNRNLYDMKSRIYEVPKKWNGIKPKDLIGIPWMLAFALRERGWYLRSDIIWHKINALPEAVKDRPAKCYEHIFTLTEERGLCGYAGILFYGIARDRTQYGARKAAEPCNEYGQENARIRKLLDLDGDLWDEKPKLNSIGFIVASSVC